MQTLFQALWHWCVWIGKVLGDWLTVLVTSHPRKRSRVFQNQFPQTCRRVFASPKPKWVQHEIIHLKAVMPQAGCRTIAHHFNRRWKPTRQMTVSKTMWRACAGSTST